MTSQALVIHQDPRRPWLAARSARSLRAAGFRLVHATASSLLDGPCLLLKAGLVLRNPQAFRPPPHANGQCLVAIGLPCAGPWADFHTLHGGDYPSNETLPAAVCEWHSHTANALARMQGAALCGGARVVHWAALDLTDTDDCLRVFEVVTSLQHGGAEKIARDLASALHRHEVVSRMIVLGKPHRAMLDAPPDTCDLSHLPRVTRASALVEIAVAGGADVLHVHLIDAEETRALSTSGIPLIATVHNTRAAWPRGWESLERQDICLMLACSQAVECELRDVLPHLPVRTVWNGIHPNNFPETPLPPSAQGFVLACIANPRPQKRLDRLPAILAATRSELIARGVASPEVRLVIAGETSIQHADSMASKVATERQAEKHGVADRITWTDGRLPVREVLAASHALVSCSAHEGLSLAHLEALSCGRPVVACDTGGTRELAWRNPALCLLDSNATPEDFARVLADVLLDPPLSAHRLVWRDFTVERMAERVARFARQAACCPGGPGTTLWFVANNLSTGGAQSSLRRLAKGLHARGRQVRVALLQEYAAHPTAGRLDLTANGIEVFVPPPAGLIEPTVAVDLILSEMAAAPPAAVWFWNAISEHKILLADALPFTPVHDISPGEMWHHSLARCLDNPPPGLPCRTARDYGRLLDGIVVKYSAETVHAAAYGTRVSVIPNGVLLPPSPVRRSALASPLVFGTAARISPQKRLDELLSAFRMALPGLPPGVLLRIAGGVESGAEACAQELLELSVGLSVEWLGELADLSSFHESCDLFVMISDPAGCPNASLEALAAGLPVIATDVGGTSEQVIQDVTGLLVPARDVVAMARGMVELAADPERRTRMGRAAREHIQRHFLLDRMISDYEALIPPPQEKAESRPACYSECLYGVVTHQATTAAKMAAFQDSRDGYPPIT